ncbi:MAG: hypothetical protein ACYTGR_17770 [Planctomycetota bacterium]|jgi:hypothetical protein
MTIGLSNTDDSDALVIHPLTDQDTLHGSVSWSGGEGGPMNVGWSVPATDGDGLPTPQSVAGNWPQNRVLFAQMTFEPDPDGYVWGGAMGLVVQTRGEIQTIAVDHEALEIPCSGTSEGDCCEANGSDSCNHPPCCYLVCEQDQFCCLTSWDQACADLAAEFCTDTCGPSCPADTNGDATVDVTDLVSVILAWGPCGDCPEDVDGNGTVDVADLVEVILSWGPCS